MNLRLRCHLAFLPLFLGFTGAAAALAYLVERRQVAWRLEQEVETEAVCLAAFVRADLPGGPLPDLTKRVLAATRLSTASGGLTVNWFEPNRDGWRTRLLVTTSGLLMPAAPAGAVLARVNAGDAATVLRRRADTNYDEAIGYAGVYDADGAVRAIIGVTARDVTRRAELRTLASTTGWLALGGILGSIVVAETITRRARTELAAVTTQARALARGETRVHSEASLIAELDDLADTLDGIGRILSETATQTRRRYLQSGPEPSDEAVARSCRAMLMTDQTDGTPGAPGCLVRSLRGAEPEDFLGLCRVGAGWAAMIGRLEPPSSALSDVQRTLRAAAARDYACGLLETGAVADVCAALHRVFPLVRGALVIFAPHEPLRIASFGSVPPLTPVALAADDSPVSSHERDGPGRRTLVLGTVGPRELTFARDYLREARPGELVRSADELATLLAESSRGLLLILSLP